MRPRFLPFALATLLAPALANAQTVEGLDPRVKVTASTSPAKLTLSWNASDDVSQWTVKRREGTTGAFTVLAASLPKDTSSYEDTSVEKGKTYEYQVARQGASSSGTAWVLAGIEVPFVDDPGVVALVIDSSMSSLSQLDRLADDLAREGWTVEKVLVDPSSKPPEVRAQLQALQKKHGARFTTAFLLGGVPRAFSGLINPDGHPDHLGAWPADAYYADLDGNWTDDADLGGEGTHVNKKGDGKFDQSAFPSDLELAIGRVDTVGLPAFAPATASDLLARYLDADHAYRSGAMPIKERAFVSDNFGYFSGEAFARIAWRDSWALYGADPTKDKPFFDALEEEGGYAFAIGCGGGTPTGAGGIGSTTDFVNRKPQAVFLGLFGSYFGDWSFDDDFLRAALVSKGAALATTWFARPWHHFHHLGALRTFGDSFKIMANAKGAYDTGFAARGVHMALLGDPTLRIFVARPPTGLTATSMPAGVQLSWSPSPDATAGYHVYRNGTRLTDMPTTSTTFGDVTLGPSQTASYRVVAVRLRTTGSGTFYEHSPGAIAQGTAGPAGDGGSTDEDPSDAGPSAAPDGGDASSSSGCGCSTAGRASASPLFVIAVVLSFRRRAARA